MFAPKFQMGRINCASTTIYFDWGYVVNFESSTSFFEYVKIVRNSVKRE